MRPPQAVRWSEDGSAVDLLDQTRLPGEEVRRRLESADAVAEAIRTLRVRGAPAIGIAAALGLAIEMERHASRDAEGFRSVFDATDERLRRTRPTAVNLFWALDRMRRRARTVWRDGAGAEMNERVVRALREEATEILDDDRERCRRIGDHGLRLLGSGDLRVLTHCNAGALATGGIGTALAPIYRAHAQDRRVRVYAGETRPVLQGSRLTAWELDRAGIDVTLIADTATGAVLGDGRVDAVIVGADRIAANGDVANKIGTYAIAVLARHHGIPFYVAAPTSTIDPDTPTGAEIPIEERDPDEVRCGFGRATAPRDIPVYAPAFDITPAGLVDAVITERGAVRSPTATGVARVLEAAGA